MTTTPIVGTTFFGVDVSQLADQLMSIRRRLSKRVLLLEFGLNVLNLAEASLARHGVQLNHISSVVLPSDALERGVPADPSTMAKLITQICSEKKIPAHRVAVVLSPEVAFQRVVDLPSELSTDEVRSYVLNPANGLQIPFPLWQTDFDITPILNPEIARSPMGKQLYLLSAIPQELVDRVIETLRFANLELQQLELGNFSQLRSLVMNLMTLAPQQVELVLELGKDYSNLMMVNSSGLLRSERLAPIRDFPQLEFDDEQMASALESGISAESLIIEEENYLPISALDLQVLIADLNSALVRFKVEFPDIEVLRLQLTGINSAHASLVDLLVPAFGFPVAIHRPLLSPGIANFQLDDVLVRKSLGRLVGLALGLLPRTQLCSQIDSLDRNAALDFSSTSSSDQSLDPIVHNSDLTFVQMTSVEQAKVNVEQPSCDLPYQVDLGEAVIEPVSVDAFPKMQDRNDTIQKNVIDLSCESGQSTLMDTDELDEEEIVEAKVVEEEWPSIVGEEVSEEEIVEAKVVEEEWPSIVGEEVSEEEIVEAKVVEEEWPSIVGEEVSEEEIVEAKVVEEEWPSIVGEEVSEEEIVEAKVVEEEWPSIGGEDFSADENKKIRRNGGEDLLVTSTFSDGDHNQESLAIPGLPIHAVKASSVVNDPKSPAKKVSQGKDSLGDLRFADSGDID